MPVPNIPQPCHVVPILRKHNPGSNKNHSPVYHTICLHQDDADIPDILPIMILLLYSHRQLMLSLPIPHEPVDIGQALFLRHPPRDGSYVHPIPFSPFRTLLSDSTR